MAASHSDWAIQQEAKVFKPLPKSHTLANEATQLAPTPPPRQLFAKSLAEHIAWAMSFPPGRLGWGPVLVSAHFLY